MRSDDEGASFVGPWKTEVIGPVSNAAMITMASGEVILAHPQNYTNRAGDA
jgi:hypothetical protein